mmetsp:Transcript_24823/g.98545  ORF Transcript_24823/g.98545 Transcript_24823/m.98545 type:complete len:244 (+) Transcript_24823:2739-3470(+)
MRPRLARERLVRQRDEVARDLGREVLARRHDVGRHLGRVEDLLVLDVLLLLLEVRVAPARRRRGVLAPHLHALGGRFGEAVVLARPRARAVRPAIRRPDEVPHGVLDGLGGEHRAEVGPRRDVVAERVEAVVHGATLLVGERLGAHRRGGVVEAGQPRRLGLVVELGQVAALRLHRALEEEPRQRRRQRTERRRRRRSASRRSMGRPARKWRAAAASEVVVVQRDDAVRGERAEQQRPPVWHR